MKHWLYAYRQVSGRPAELADLLRTKIDDLLREAIGPDAAPPAADGSLTLGMTSRVAGLPATKAIRVATGVARSADGRTIVPLTWHAEPARHAFPVFEGAVELQPLSSSLAEVTLVGSYAVPLGPVGAAADLLALGSVAERTTEELVEGIARALRGTVGQPDEPAPARPAGAAMRVRDIMSRDPLVLEETQPLRSAAMVLFHQRVSGAPVVAADGGLVGVLSERDLLEKAALLRYGLGRKASEAERRRRAVAVGEACSRPARVTTPETSLRAAAREMLDHGVSRLVVVDESRVAGIVSRHDVLQSLVRADAEIQQSVDAALAPFDEAGVRATVIWGEVRVEGVARLRSRVAQVVRRLEQVDGVIAVYGDLQWDEDDVAPPVVVSHPMA